MLDRGSALQCEDKNRIFPIRGQSFFYAFLLALASGVFVDYFAQSFLGAIICSGIGLAIILISIRRYELAVNIFLYVILLSPPFPRKLIDLRGTQELIAFYTFTSFQIMGISISLWTIIGLMFVAMVKSRCRFETSNNVIKISIFLLFALMGLMYFASLFNLIFSHEIIVKELISDHRFFVILIGGVYISVHYVYIAKVDLGDSLAKTLLLVGLAIGTRSILFFVKDRMLGEFNIDFSALPFLLYPILFGILQTYKISYITIMSAFLILVGAFSIGRLDLVLGILLGLIFIIRNMLAGNLRNTLRFFIIPTTVVVIITLFIVFNQKAFDFMIFKMNTTIDLLTVNGAISKSPKVRLYEAKNILSEESENVIPLIVGKGFGASFDFRRNPLPFNLDISDYSENELKSGRYFRPHFFISYTMLKGGVLFLVFYIYIIWLLASASWKKRQVSHPNDFIMNFGFYYSIFAINMYWQGHQIFMFAFLFVFVLLNNFKKVERNP